MLFDPQNKIVQRCAEGMTKEGEGNPAEALALFMSAWNEAVTDIEKFIAAHYVARHQNSIADKLQWDELAVMHALQTKEEGMNAHLPSLYLNIAKCHEDLQQPEQAAENYEMALYYADYLPDDGYGKLIRSGIHNGLERMKQKE